MNKAIKVFLINLTVAFGLTLLLGYSCKYQRLNNAAKKSGK